MVGSRLGVFARLYGIFTDSLQYQTTRGISEKWWHQYWSGPLYKENTPSFILGTERGEK